MLSVGVARPAAAVRVPRDRATVMIDIDVSLSMEATDVLPSRLQAAKKAGKQFADLLPARINLGLISFARNANVLVAPTLDREPVKKAIDGLHLANYTAIGEAIFSSIDAIHVFAQATTAKGDKPPPARVVLLSDGSNTTGRSIPAAIAAARAAHVQISTIAFGTPNGTVTGDNGEQVPVPGRHRGAEPDRAADRRDVPHRHLGAGTAGGLQGHRFADRLHDRASRHLVALPRGRAAVHPGSRGGVDAVVRPPDLNATNGPGALLPARCPTR